MPRGRRPLRAAHRRGRRHRQRPGAAASGGEPLLARLRRQRRAALGEGRRAPLRPGGRAARARRRAAAGPGAEIARPGEGAFRRTGAGPGVLPFLRGEAGRHPGHRDAHRLDRRARLRAVSPRPGARRRPVEPRAEGGQALPHRAHRPVRHPPHRGRHPQLRHRHDPRQQPLRGRTRAAGEPGQAPRLHRPGRFEKDSETRNEKEAGRRGDRRRENGHEHDALPGEGRRLRHVVRVLAAPEEEHRLRHAAGRKSLGEEAEDRGAGRRTQRYHRTDAVHRPEEGDREVMKKILLLWLVALPAFAQVTVREYLVPPGHRVHDVWADAAPDGPVWISAQGSGNLGILDPKTGKVEFVPLGRGSSPHGVVAAADGAPWLTDGGQNAIVRVDPKTRAVKVWPLPADSGYTNLNTAIFDGKGIHWFTGQSGIYGRLDPKTGEMKLFEAPKGRGPYGIHATPDGTVYYASLAGSFIGKINPDGTTTVIEPPTRRQGARRVWSDSKGNIWVAEWNSGNLSRYEPKSGKWSAWQAPGDEPQIGRASC